VRLGVLADRPELGEVLSLPGGPGEEGVPDRVGTEADRVADRGVERRERGVARRQLGAPG
jgi:hypothetical protein